MSGKLLSWISKKKEKNNKRGSIIAAPSAAPAPPAVNPPAPPSGLAAAVAELKNGVPSDKKSKKKLSLKGFAKKTPAPLPPINPEPDPSPTSDRKAVTFDSQPRFQTAPDVQSGAALLSPETANTAPDDNLGYIPEFEMSLESCKRRGVDLCSLSSRSLKENQAMYDPDRSYARDELMQIIELLADGVNNREGLRSRYEEENSQLSVNLEFQLDKIQQNKQRIDCLRNNQTELNAQLTDNEVLLNRNHLQLARERKRVEGAIDLKEDFDKQLQTRISAKSKLANEYQDILRNLNVLLEDSSLQWLQKETMLSTESEALERLHKSVEKEHELLRTEHEGFLCLHATKSAQNNKLSTAVEEELEEFAKKQQEIIKYNEKRIRALEGCIRTMQLDREVMYGETSDNRRRLQEVVEGRVNAFMNKVRRYRDLLNAINDEIRSLTYRHGGLVRVSQALNRYADAVSAIDAVDLEEKVRQIQTACERTEKCWDNKANQKRELVDTRKAYVELQRQHMLNSEEEYFLMEPVDVPGVDSVTAFQKSAEDISQPVQNFGGDTGLSDGGESLEQTSLSPVQADLTSTGYSQARPGRTSFRDETLDRTTRRRSSSKAQAVIDSVTRQPKKAADAVTSAFRRLSVGMGIR